MLSREATTTGEHLPILMAKRGGNAQKALALLRSLTDLAEIIASKYMPNSRAWRERGQASVILKTGQFSPRH